MANCCTGGRYLPDAPALLRDSTRPRRRGTRGRAGPFRIYWQVCLPLVRGAMLALSIFTFLGLWNALFWPRIVLGEREVFTRPVGLVIMQQRSYIQRGLAFAAACIASAPVLLFYAIFQHKITAGITTTGMAGR